MRLSNNLHPNTFKHGEEEWNIYIYNSLESILNNLQVHAILIHFDIFKHEDRKSGVK